MEKKLTESLKIIKQDEEVVSPASRIPYHPFVMKRGEGTTIEDIDGNRYIDFLSSDVALNTGHTHPRVVGAIKERFPFSILGIYSDNGSEFINAQLLRYCEENQITFT